MSLMKEKMILKQIKIKDKKFDIIYVIKFLNF